ncbi:MAG: PEP-CTERM sorting domain-containing protein [Phycisphaerae bacterium]|nr:PEP-CTERM sorting domain-containing protein [Phycisphaerae bacterium]
MMKNQKLACGCVVALAGILSLFVAPSSAALIDDPNAMPSWQGSKTFYTADPLGTIDIDVEYAVYFPGDYENSGVDPSGGTEYVYAYQIFNDRLESDLPASILTVGIDPDADVADIGDDSTSGTPLGTIPTFSAFSGTPATSAVYYFFSNAIDAPSEWSGVLIFTSPDGPTWRSASISAGGPSDMQVLPSPTPEPATMAFLLLGIGGLLLRRKR